MKCSNVKSTMCVEGMVELVVVMKCSNVKSTMCVEGMVERLLL